MIRLIQGDCLQSLRELESDSLDSLVTDPPAGIGFMGKSWDSDKGGRDEWVAWLADVMRECRRVLKPGAHGLVWALPRTSHWTATALEDAGFEVRDVVVHLTGQGFPKSLNVEKAIRRVSGDADSWRGWGTALKPCSEHWILVRKPIAERNVAANVMRHGTGALNIDGCRIGTDSTRRPLGRKMGSGEYNGRSPGRESLSQVGGSDCGRFPANLVLSHRDDCEQDCCSPGCAVATLDEQAGYLHGPGNKKLATEFDGGTSMFGLGAKGAPNIIHDRGGTASRFFYVAKASRSDRGEGNTHPTVKSTKLMAYLCRLVTPPSGTVLDPFMGSGSTGVAAKAEGLKFIGIEREPQYFAIAKERLGA